MGVWRKDGAIYAGEVGRVVLAGFQWEEGFAVFAEVFGAEGDGFHDFPALHLVQHGLGAGEGVVSAAHVGGADEVGADAAGY